MCSRKKFLACFCNIIALCFFHVRAFFVGVVDTFCAVLRVHVVDWAGQATHATHDLTVETFGITACLYNRGFKQKKLWT